MRFARIAPRGIALIATAAVALAAVAAILLAGGRGSGGGDPAGDGRPRSLDARFAALSTATSNQCGLRADALRRLPPRARLQGSCCDPMDRVGYGQQIRGLRRYSGLRVIPTDPYDILVSLARALLSYRGLPLGRAQRSTFRRAIELSAEHGPCCCHCWRWQAFSGQARYLIRRHRFSASRLARVWNLEIGCGGRPASV